MSSGPPAEALAVVAFWFDPAHRDRWYATDPDFDALIRRRFGHRLEQGVAGGLDEWIDTPAGWLALLIVLDQFPRNLYRRDPRAWAQDSHTQRLTLSGIAQGFDRRLPLIRRVFAYMPLEHAENIDLQRRSVSLFEALCNDAPPGKRDSYAGFLDYARRHEAVIVRFGRFPHRNAVLGRTCTAHESAYLAEPGAGF